jgi:Sushi repeat (SCR repeat)
MLRLLNRKLTKTCRRWCTAVYCKREQLPNISGVAQMIDASFNSLTLLQQPVTERFPFGAAVVYWCQNGTKFEDGRMSHAVTCNDYGQWDVPSTLITCSGINRKTFTSCNLISMVESQLVGDLLNNLFYASHERITFSCYSVVATRVPHNANVHCELI